MQDTITDEQPVAGARAARPRGPDFSHVDAWLFDLDNTLYPFGSAVLLEAEQRICRFIEERFGLTRSQAWWLQKDCLQVHGSTLSGLIARFAIDPEPYLAFVNDVDVATLSPAPRLKQALARLPGKRIVFTNNCGNYAARVLDRLGIAEEFHQVCDIRSLGFRAKPQAYAYDAVRQNLGIEPKRIAMFEDAERNLVPAHKLGMTTVWLRTPPDASRDAPAHVHHDIADLTEFLEAIELKAPS